ncbi:bifunctional diguanylate cyclase/phosphodiesterase [Photobacterium atrarenae]|uniref:EAL domain-containing protein n=1 Tax=Photobacterium atrarenae TaxID=865757 RepID=A0ABY5GJG6_9GAMM|nr:EAL domain-containing protein [Photobacterium atrarenae]UTV28854.1 EAL domain-containing protein [Photobacterium atrarenae]
MNTTIENALKRLHGNQLFDEATHQLCEFLSPKHCFIGYFDETRQYARTLSYRINGELTDNFTYPLAGTPCHLVQRGSQGCSYPANIQEHFPDDLALREMNVEGYLGIPVFTDSDEPVGIVVCLFDTPYQHSEAAQQWCQELSYLLGVELKYTQLLSKQEKLLWELEEGQRVAKVGSWFWDLTADTISWSQEIYRIYGIEDTGLTPSIDLLSEFIHPEDRDWVLSSLHESIESDSVSYNLVHRAQLADGSIKYLRKRADVIRDKQGKPLLMRGTVHDVTDVYQISAKLTKTSHKLNTTFNSVEEGIWEYDLISEEFFTSPKFWNILGRDKPKDGSDFAEWIACIHPEDRAEGLSFFQRFIQQNFTSVFQFEFRLSEKRYPDLQRGQERWLKLKGSVIAKNDKGEPTRIAGIQRDITNTVEARRQLNRAQVVFDNTSECILITDCHNKIISVNRAFEQTTGYREKELLGQTPSVLSSGLHEKEYYQELWYSLSTIGHWKGEVWNKRKNGEIYPEEMSINVIRDSNGDIVNYVAVFRDISHWKKAEEQLTFYAYCDPLTGLVNRRSFVHRVEKKINSVSKKSDVFSLLFIDMDDFKSINDLYGHDFGDRVLTHIAERLKKLFPTNDNICRYGGDEFCVLLPDSGAGDAKEIAHEVVAAVSQPLLIDGVTVNTTVSIGVSTYPESGQTHHALLKNADYAMYNMKGRGRNGVCEYDGDLQSEYLQKLRLRDRLKKAIADEALTVYYQPIVDAQTGQISKFEALVRWFDEVEGFVSPAVFIPLAEKYGLIKQLGSFVLHQACRDLKVLHDAGYEAICFSVNRSVKEFINNAEEEQVWEVIQQYELPDNAIIVEITESTASKESSDIQCLLNHFKQRDIKVAMDDFGTGYSSLSAVVDLRPDIIKIDREFIKEIEQSPDSQTLVSLIIDLSEKLGIQVVAEGVETQEQLKLLREMRCQYVQGFYFSQAVPLERCFTLLQQQ